MFLSNKIGYSESPDQIKFKVVKQSDNDVMQYLLEALWPTYLFSKITGQNHNLVEKELPHHL